jgi:hypothetical protein
MKTFTYDSEGGLVGKHASLYDGCFRADRCHGGPSQDDSGYSIKVRALTRPGTYNRPSSGPSAWGDSKLSLVKSVLIPNGSA